MVVSVYMDTLMGLMGMIKTEMKLLVMKMILKTPCRDEGDLALTKTIFNEEMDEELLSCFLFSL